MSFAIKLKAMGGKLSIVSDGPHPHAHVPDGEYTVNGHQDDRGTSLTVTQLDPSQQVIIQAQAYSPAPPKAAA